MKKLILYSFYLLLFCASCQKVDMEGKQSIPVGEPIAAKFQLASDLMENATISASTSADGLEITPTSENADTKASAEDGLIELERTIDNVIIAQFNGTADDAVLVGTPTYVAIYDDETLDATLSVSETDNTIIFIANTGDITAKISAGITLAQLKEITFDIPDQLVLDVDDFLPMVGTWVGPISMTSLNANNKIIKVPMKRVMAKIAMTVESAVSDLTINKVSVSNVPTSVCLFTPKEASNFTTYSVPTYSVDDDRYIWFMPENMSNSNNTQIEISASKDGKNYIYTTQLNVDNGADYKVKRNIHHNLTVTIKRLTEAQSEMYLTFDSHGEIYALDMKKVAEDNVPGYDKTATKLVGYNFALNTWAQAGAGASANYALADKCLWLQLYSTKVFSPSWISNPGSQYATGNPSSGTTRNIYLFVNENMSAESRFCKIRARFDQITVNGGVTTDNIILNIEQKGSTVVGQFGDYDIATGTYKKQLVMESIEDDNAMTWTAAKDICATKFYDPANKNWYLPSQAQLLAIWIANFESTHTLKDSYWSATNSGGNAWGLDMSTGIIKSESQTTTKKVRCVRDLDGTNI